MDAELLRSKTTSRRITLIGMIMTTRILVILLLAGLVAGCSSDPTVVPEESIVAEKPIINADEAHDFLEFSTLTVPDLPEERWEYEDGAKICSGYLTRIDSQDFCAAEVPSDWVPFTYEGQTYYVQPLSGG